MEKEDSIKNNMPRKNVMSRDEIQQALIDNFISLQKVMTNLSVKFEELSTNISKLLQLFEISAKTFAERYSTEKLAPENAVDSELISKLSTLLDQNKIISKGIMLIEEKIREKNNNFGEQQLQGRPTQQYSYPIMQQPYPMMQPMMLPSMQPQQFQQLPQQLQQPPAPSTYKKEIGANQDTNTLKQK
jgi:hypothetical protein